MLLFDIWCHFQQYVSYIVANSFIGGENLRTRRKQSTSRIMLYTSPWSRFELTISVGKGTDCLGSCKSNYWTINVTAAPRQKFKQWWSTRHVSYSNYVTVSLPNNSFTSQYYYFYTLSSVTLPDDISNNIIISLVHTALFFLSVYN